MVAQLARSGSAQPNGPPPPLTAGVDAKADLLFFFPTLGPGVAGVKKNSPVMSPMPLWLPSPMNGTC